MDKIAATPAEAPHPVENFLQPGAREQSKIAAATCNTATALPCSIPVTVGLFFDGTNNNMERDRDGKRTGLPDPKTGLPALLPNKPLKPEEYSHSNVARLFRAFPDNKQASGYLAFYIQGVGTPFKEIRELTESDSGKAFARGGQPRIVWGLLQVLNAIHRTNQDGDTPLYSDKQVGQLAGSYGNEVGRTEQSDVYRERSTVMTHRAWFAPHVAKLTAALALRPKPSIPSLTVSVFGFSRGAAEAVAFCHLFADLLDDAELAGIAANINFLGLFDTVASVGGSASVAQTTLAPGAIFDGHWAWAEQILKPLPDCVKSGLHCIATHEQRMNFPVTSLVGNIDEVYFPGVHSDVGGGYAPGEQGKARGAQSALLSQIPLLHMFQAARLKGVPLTPFSELPLRDQEDFKVHDDLAAAWNAYTAALGKEGSLLTKHMQLYYRWRAARLHSLASTASFKAASAQEQQDMGDANRMLAGDLKALRFRRETKNRDDNKDHYSYADMANINH